MALILYAQEGNHIACLKELDQGVDPNITNHNGWTALHFAAYKDHRKCLHLLLDRGANPHITDIVGKIPLFWAVSDNRAYCIEFLLELGLQYFKGDTWTPEQWALYDHYKGCIRFLCKKFERFNSIDQVCITEIPRIKELIQIYQNLTPK